MCCRHCGSSCSSEKGNFLSFEVIRKVLDEVAAAYSPRSIMICLSGGEPMLHPDFYDIAAYATALGFSCGITTNATLIDEEAAVKIREAGIRSVSVSLDGLEDTHNWMRNSRTAFDRTVRGLIHLVNLLPGGSIVQATTVVHNGNMDQLEDLYRFVKNLGIDSWRLTNVEPIGRALEQDAPVLDEGSYEKLLRYIRDKRFDPECSMEVCYGCSHYLTIPYEHMVRNNYFICGSGISVASVLANGDIYSCMDIERRPELVQGNVYRDDFVWVWENRFEAFRRDRSALCEDCLCCEDRLFCEGDSAHTWDYDKNEPKLCLKKIIEREERKEWM